MPATIDTARPKWRKHATGMLVGAVLGGAGAAGTLALVDAGVLGAPGGSELAALLVALVYLLMGLAVGVGVVAPGLGARFLNVEDAAELGEERAALIPSALGCILLAIGLAALALGGEGGALSPPVALTVFLGSCALGVWFSVRTLRAADELMRALMQDSAAASFYALFLVLGGWAALAHLGFAPALALLDIVILFYGLTLVVCFWVIGRRGMLVR